MRQHKYGPADNRVGHGALYRSETSYLIDVLCHLVDLFGARHGCSVALCFNLYVYVVVVVVVVFLPGSKLKQQQPTKR